jgi:hypothetical protein
VHRFPSLQPVPSSLLGFEHEPVDELHVPAVWHESEAVHTTGLLPVHAPPWQLSVCVQALPSLQEVPLVAAGFEQAPVEELHVPTVWHWSEAVHTTRLLPTQAPDWQVSVCVQASPSLQGTPDRGEDEHAPVDGLHVPAE